MSMCRRRSPQECWLCKLQSCYRNIREDLIAAGLKSCASVRCRQGFGLLLPPIVETVNQPLHPMLCLDGVSVWSSNESFYVIGLSAWWRIKPFVSFFSHGFGVKSGSAFPCGLLESSSNRPHLLWHAVAGFPEEDASAYIREPHKVWLKIPERCDESFQCLVRFSLGMHLFRGVCRVRCGKGLWSMVQQPIEDMLREIRGVESEVGTAEFFVKAFSELSLGRQHWHKFITRTITIDAEDSVHDSMCIPVDRLQSRTEYQATQSSADDLQVEDTPLTEIKSELKSEPHPDVGFEASVGCVSQGAEDETSPAATVKCPGCPAFYSGDRVGLNAMSHHFISSHRRQACGFRKSLRMKFLCQALRGDSSEVARRRSLRSKKIRKL